MTDDRPEHDLRAAMHRHPSGRRRAQLRAVPRVSHNCEQPPRPGSDQVNTALSVAFLAIFIAGVLASVWLDWRWLVVALALDLVVAFVGGRRQR